MSMRSFDYLVTTLFALAYIQQPARASLGQDANSIEQDRAALGGSAISQTSNQNYSVYEFTAQGNTIREYVSSDGLVFAVHWKGVSRLDVSSVLGTHHADYHAQISARGMNRARHMTSIKTARSIVLTGGRGRGLYGKAHVPHLVPAGLDIGSLP